MNKRSLTCCASCLAVGLVSLTLKSSASVAAAKETGNPTVAVQIDTRAAGVPVSPLLYGAFFEEINHAGDGGLYAELVRNRSFDEENAGTPLGWSLVARNRAQGNLALDASLPLNTNNRRALRLEAREGTTRRRPVGVANEGFWGIPARKGESLRLSVYARADAAFRANKGNLRAGLEAADGHKTYSEVTVTPDVAEGWAKYEVTLKPSATDPRARLLLTLDAPGIVWLDMVSLFPAQTWNNRPNGLRRDLAEHLDAMKPAFVRFPGGCFVEGETMATAFRWKDTIGDPAERPGRACLWGYRATEGLGYHEYLQLCEDLKSDPLLVVNVGMSHRGNVPMAELEPWIQDCLDAIEYANGPVTSKWGALRARNGHPAPYNLRLVEVGNENGGAAYDERYARFYDAIRAKYPQVKIVANVWGGIPKSRPADLIDEHYYNSPEWFFAHARQYDNRPRTAGSPKVYVGEYAVTRGAGLGNLRAALAEAAFMTGMERNADLVEMSSYAPLFVNVNDRKWNPDAIGFDATRSFGTPSYYVQKLFANNRPDTTLPVTLTAPKTAEAPIPAGVVGVGTWKTQAEYKDITVTRADGRTVSLPAPTPGGNGWRTGQGNWSVEDGGVIRQSDADTEGARYLAALPADAFGSDYTMTLKARKTSGNEGFLILFRVRGQDDWYWWNIGGWNNTRHAVQRSTGTDIISPEVVGRIETGRWYDVKVEAKGRHIRCWLDGQLIHDFEEDAAPPLLFATAGRMQANGEIIIKAVNGTDAPQPATIALNGFAGVPVGFATVLTGPSQQAENSLDAPQNVAPAPPQAVRGTSTGSLQYTLSPRSVTVLRIRQAKP